MSTFFSFFLFLDGKTSDPQALEKFGDLAHDGCEQEPVGGALDPPECLDVRGVSSKVGFSQVESKCTHSQIQVLKARRFQ